MARIVPATEEWIDRAAEIIRSGGLVAFPTETVYGLGANALDGAAVESIFAAKGRPASNPVIVHIAGVEQLIDVAAPLGALAETLADAFWPGPLTLVLPKSASVPAIVTAGGETVGVRIPDHPVALALLRKSGVPIAAPSANRSESVSPTRAEHVAESLGDAVDLILDGGSCSYGIESTVLDICADPPAILRPGAISAARISQVILAEPTVSNSAADTRSERSPGRIRRHYAPRAPLTISPDAIREAAEAEGSGVLTHVAIYSRSRRAIVHILPQSPEGYARGLYAALRQLDAAGVTRIYVQAVPDTPEWLAIRDRLRRASEPERDGAV